MLRKIRKGEKMETKFEKGKIIIVTTGELSNYSIIGCFRVVKEFDARKMVFDFIEEKGIKINSNASIDNFIEVDEFIKWLSIDKGVLEEIKYKEWHFDLIYNEKSTIISDEEEVVVFDYTDFEISS